MMFMYKYLNTNKKENNMDIKDMQVTVAKGYYKAGITEDGMDYEAECYTVKVTSKDGKQWLHNKTWFTSFPRTVHMEDGQSFEEFSDTREFDLHQAEAMVRVVEKVGSIGLSYWTETEPMYGSEAYCKQYGF